MDGRILKPTHPAMSIDSTFIQRAFGSGGPEGYFAAAFTEVVDQRFYVYIQEMITACINSHVD